MACGQLAITRREEGPERFAWRVRFGHETSGEDLCLTFRTGRDELRCLESGWSVGSSNDAPDSYEGLALKGRFSDCDRGREVVLNVQDRFEFRSGIVEPDRPCVCNWTLFDLSMDTVSEMEDQKLNVLEDLEKVKSGCVFRFLDTYRLALPGRDRLLTGYTLHGRGREPGYWWWDEQGRVAIVSTVFQTFVLHSDRKGER
jgi:hypothetical protein